MSLDPLSPDCDSSSCTQVFLDCQFLELERLLSVYDTCRSASVRRAVCSELDRALQRFWRSCGARTDDAPSRRPRYRRRVRTSAQGDCRVGSQTFPPQGARLGRRPRAPFFVSGYSRLLRAWLRDRRFAASRLAKTVERQMAIVLIEECEEALVVPRRHPEQLNELSVVALGPLQSSFDDLTQVGFCQLPIDESGIDDGPETLATDHHRIPEHLGARLRFD